MKYPLLPSIKKIFFLITVIVSINQLVACSISNMGRKNTYEEQMEMDKIRPGLSKMYNSLLNAAAPLCKYETCSYPLKIVDNKEINAFTDGMDVYVTTGMLEFANTNEELAVILSHELAHSVMGHIDSKQKNQILGLILDLAAHASGVETKGEFTKLAGQVYSQEFELEADYVGLYIMARAGYPVNNAAHIWRKMAKRFPQNIQGNIMSSHPGSAERFVILEKTAQEIAAKKRNKQILLPEALATTTTK